MTAAGRSPDAVRRRRAVVVLVVLVVLVGGLGVGGLLALRPAGRASRAPVVAVTPPAVARPEPGWDMSAEMALATRPMLKLPVQDALPQPVSATPPADVIMVPPAGQTQGVWIAQGFPPTPEGAVAQLQALGEQALVGVDPDVVTQAYRTVAEPGAPDPATSTPYRTVASLRAAAGLPAQGAVPGMTATYQVTSGLIKGIADGGKFAVVCVLGVLSAENQGRSAQAGLGICEGMRWIGGQWRIAALPRAADATNAWPGSDAAIQAGYRELRHA